MDKILKYFPHSVLIFGLTIYGVDKSWVAFAGLFICLLPYLYYNASVDMDRDRSAAILAAKAKQKANEFSLLETRLIELESKLTEQAKTLESVRTAVNMRQLGR